MIFDPVTGALWTSDGRFLKRLDCPKAMKWDELGRTYIEPPSSESAAKERARDCSYCSTKVTSLEGLSDDEVTAMLEKEPGACVYLRGDWKTVTVLQRMKFDEYSDRFIWGAPGGETLGVDAQIVSESRSKFGKRTRRVHTARTLTQMNAAAKQGLRVVIKKVPGLELSLFHEKVSVWQNTETGEVLDEAGYWWWREAQSADTEGPWRNVLRLNRVYSYRWPLPFAAYLVPKDLRPNTRVLLTDPIEDIVGWDYNGTWRARMVPATWTGADIEVHAELVEVPRVVG
jgi:hypothetical protein